MRVSVTAGAPAIEAAKHGRLKSFLAALAKRDRKLATALSKRVKVLEETDEISTYMCGDLFTVNFELEKDGSSFVRLTMSWFGGQEKSWEAVVATHNDDALAGRLINRMGSDRTTMTQFAKGLVALA